MRRRVRPISLPRAASRFETLAFRIALACVLSLVSTAASAQTSAGEQYEQMLAREKVVRAATPVDVEALRSVAKSYERIVRRFPTSGYSDNALWQAAGLYTLAHDESDDTSDRQEATRLLQWLKREYPSSSLIRGIPEELARLAKQAAKPPPKATPSSPPSPRHSPSSAAPPQSTVSAAALSAPALAVRRAESPPASADDSASARTLLPGSTKLPPASGTPAVLKSVQLSTLPRGERVTLEFSRPVPFAGERLDGPDRVFVDLANTTTPAPVLQDIERQTGSLVKALRVGRHPDSITRVVLELTQAPRSSAFVLYDPFRLVIDVESAEPPPLAPVVPPPPPPPPPSSPPPVVTSAALLPTSTRPVLPSPPPPRPEAPAAGAGAAAPKPQPPKPEPARPPSPTPTPPRTNSNGDYSLARQLGLGVSRIVIDAGHGGHDPGASANGVRESEVVLDVALRLQKLLVAQPGLDVVLTRANDEFVALEERTAIATRERADLFLSIHVNSSPRTGTRGVETYFLNFATDPTAEAVAARENAASTHTMGALTDVVRKITMNSKIEESRDFATMVQASLVRRLSAQNRALQDLGVKQAPFVVLIGAQMPSVLAEIAFLSNKNEAALLKEPTYRQKIAQALCDAILKYQTSLKQLAGR